MVRGRTVPATKRLSPIALPTCNRQREYCCKIQPPRKRHLVWARYYPPRLKPRTIYIPQEQQSMPAGIYVIRNQINGHEYVGKTTHFSARWKDHRSQLCRRVHPNPHLTYAWHHYGEAAFEFRVLEVVTDLALLDERERHWGELLQPHYNIEDFGSNRISTIAPYRYSDDMAMRVKRAFDEIGAAGGVITPEGVRRRAGCSRNVVQMVLQDAEWWTPELQRAARRHKALPRVLRAYRDISETSRVLTLTEIAREAGTEVAPFWWLLRPFGELGPGLPGERAARGPRRQLGRGASAA
jgi:hypothetical protein